MTHSSQNMAGRQVHKTGIGLNAKVCKLQRKPMVRLGTNHCSPIRTTCERVTKGTRREFGRKDEQSKIVRESKAPVGSNTIVSSADLPDLRSKSPSKLIN
jgi:hypothetical protein